MAGVIKIFRLSRYTLSVPLESNLPCKQTVVILRNIDILLFYIGNREYRFPNQRQFDNSMKALFELRNIKENIIINEKVNKKEAVLLNNYFRNTWFIPIVNCVWINDKNMV